MALRNLVYEGESTLRKKCKPVTDFGSKLAVLLDDMADTMHDSNGVGLAAPQVGMLRRVVVIDTTPDEEVGVAVEMINPEIIAREGSQTGMEGCLSVPGKYGIVERPMKVTARYQDRTGHFHEITGEGLTARAICHELDHLDGVLYIDVAQRMLTQEELDALEQPKGDQ